MAWQLGQGQPLRLVPVKGIKLRTAGKGWTRRQGGEQTMYSYGLLANTYASRTAVVLECSLLSIIFRAYTLPGMGASGWMHL